MTASHVCTGEGPYNDLMDPDDYTANLLGAMAVAVLDEMTAATEAVVGMAGLAPAALVTVADHPDRPIEFLRGVLGLTHSGTVRLATRLERAGLLRRSPGADRRSRGLRLTEDGERVVAELRAERRRVLRGMIDRLDVERRYQLTGLLAELLHVPRSSGRAQRVCRLCDQAICGDTACPVGSAVN